MLLWDEHVALPRRDLRDEVVTARRHAHDGRHFVREPALVEALLLRDIRIEYRPPIAAEHPQQIFNIADRGPPDLAAGSGKLLNCFPEWPRHGSNRAVLHIDDDECRVAPNACRTSEAYGSIRLLLFLRNYIVPRFGHTCLRYRK